MELISIEAAGYVRAIREKLARMSECADDGEDVDIGRDWLDTLTTLGLVIRTQRSPAMWEITEAGEAAIRTLPAQAPAVKVRPLQWLLAEDGDFVAETSIGDYILGIPHGSWNLATSAGSIFSFHTLEAAKAAAQADYEACILAALDLS